MKHRKTLVVSLLIAGALVFLAVALINQDDGHHQFSRERLNDGIEVEAPDSWRWARDGIHLDSVRLLMGDPEEEHDPSSMIKGELGRWKYASDIEGAEHHLLFNRHGLLASCDWYVGMEEDPDLAKPTPMIHEYLKIDYPRRVPMKWKGAHNHGYQVNVQIRYPDGTWADSANYYTSNQQAIHQHTGSNEGRWRVRSLSTSGYGPWSDWVEFECVR